ncbi:MFS transporter [Rhodococcus wratislaviensis]|uniref:MFS transporter n=1 Tax=Rhodococcus wratislaviensis TaxID=44752 RepID=UPI003669A203
MTDPQSLGQPVVDLPEETNNRSLIIAVSALLGILGNGVFVMLTPLLPLMQGEYNLDLTETTWVFTALTLATATSYVIFPRLADIYGDRLSAASCGVLMLMGALLPAMVKSYPALLIGATLLGLGGAAQVLNIGILRRHLTGDALVVAVTVAVIASGIGAGAGFLVGGLALQSVTIVAFFYIMAGIFALSTIAIIAIVPSTRTPSDARVGVLGTVWLIGWITILLLGLSMAPSWGYTDPMVITLVVVGLLLAAFWVLAERRSSAAVFDLSLLKIRSVSAGFGGGVLSGAVLSNTLLLVSYYVQTPAEYGYGFGLDALGTGIVFVPFAVMMVVGGYIGGIGVDRGLAMGVSITGALVAGLGSLWFVLGHGEQWEFFIGTGLVGLGIGFSYAGIFALPQLVLSEEKAGMGAGLVGTGMIIGTSVGSALVTGILSSSSVEGAPGIPQASNFIFSFITSVVFCVGTVALMAWARAPQRQTA